MIRVTADDKAPVYGVYAVKRRPETLDISLFHAPLPNVFGSGAICWGTVQRVTDTALRGASLAEDWTMLLGSSFGDHAVGGKSKREPQRHPQAAHRSRSEKGAALSERRSDPGQEDAGAGVRG